MKATKQHFQPRTAITGYALAFASGATALVYEVLWTRRFISVFGATTPAVSATLAAIFFGFAAGASVLGPRSERWSRPLRAYGILEIGIGLGALLVAPLISLYDRIFPLLYNSVGGTSAVFLLIKTVLTFIALFVPAFLMGATIALLAQRFAPERHTIGVVGTGLYAANTLGASVGALSVPFFLLPALGARGSHFAAIAASFVIGTLAVLLDMRSFQSEPISADAAKPRDFHRTSQTYSASMTATMALLSGVFIIALEVLWTRMLAQVHENSIYSFAVVLAVFLVGLAGGAVLARTVLAKRMEVEKILGLVWIGAGLLVFVSPPLFYFLSGGMSYVTELGARPDLITIRLAVSTMLLPTLIGGMVFPLLIEISARVHRGQAGSVLGRLFAINTTGSIVGPLLATYVFFPFLGMWVSIAATGASMIVMGEIALAKLHLPASSRLRRASIAVTLSAIAFIGNPFTLPRARVKSTLQEKLIHLEEGSHEVVAVIESPQDRWMVMNNFYTLGGVAAAVEERQQARIPLLLHPAPRRIGILGLGTGITAGGALAPGVERLVALEMVPEVVSTAGKYFAEANLGVLLDRRVEVINEDARVYLKATPQRFDVIIGDLVVPWRSGESALFTRDHFQIARKALAPGGIFCQWLPMYQLSEEQFRIIAATFVDVFPQATLWRGDFQPDEPSLALIGHTDPNGLDADGVDQRVQQWSPWSVSGTPLLSTAGGIWMFLVGPMNPADPEILSARRNLENRPWIELLSARSQAEPGLVREHLYQLMERIRGGPVKGTVLKALNENHRRWQEGGAILWEATMLLSYAPDQADKRASEALAMLPRELQDIINGRLADKPPTSR